MQVVPLVREQGFLGGALAVVGIAGIPLAGLGGVAFFGSPALFALGLALPVLAGKRLGVQREPEGDALELPPSAVVEGLGRTALRICPTLVLAAVLIVGAAQVASTLAAPLGGLISGLGFFELSVIPGLTRWERRHGVPLYAAAKWFVLARSSGVYRPGPR